MVIKVFATLTLLSCLSYGQTKINPPKIDYSLYGSVAHKMQVYQYAQSRIDDLEREKYRLMREEIRRQMQSERIVVRTDRTTTCGGYDAWRRRRCQR